MGLLAPLYIAGALAVALPIVFHLIRRTPSGRQAFSSLMFLTPSPPRLTRRSRLNNIVLLLLRAAALILLALAFARPFLSRADDTTVTQARGQRVAILVDTSASMRRGDLWQQATRQADEALAALRPADEAAVYFFDRTVRPGLTFAEWNELAPGQRAAAAKARVAAASPTWAGTRLGDALATAADLLAAEDVAPAGKQGQADASAKVAGRQLVLISDLQQGGHADALQGHQWPEGVFLQVRAVKPQAPTNAGLQYVEQPVDGSDAAATAAAGPAAGRDSAGPRLRVRVTNQPGAAREQFTLAWATERGPVAGVEPVKVYVPAGRSQVVRVPWPAGATAPAGAASAPGRPAAPDRLVLAGDDADFDNTLYVVPPRQEVVRVVYVGDDAADDVKGLLYYLRGALADTPKRKIELVARRPAEPLTDADLVGTRLAVVSETPAPAAVDALQRFARGGGDVLWVLKAKGSDWALGTLVAGQGQAVPMLEATGRDYALLARVDFAHPLFAPFADARFADFTKVRFWKHRDVITTPDGMRVIASFDDGKPFLLEQAVGRGRVRVMTSGWHPADSQLALSTKFVPFIDGFVRRADGAVVAAQQTVFEPVALPAASATADASAAKPHLLTPDGRKIELVPAARATAPEATDRPGIYKLTAAARTATGTTEETPIAVNLPADESRTEPLAVEELERWGAKVGTAPTPEQLVERQRQLRRAELESRQKLWRWVIVCVLGLLAVETALAGGLARRSLRTEAGSPASEAGVRIQKSESRIQ